MIHVQQINTTDTIKCDKPNCDTQITLLDAFASMLRFGDIHKRYCKDCDDLESKLRAGEGLERQGIQIRGEYL